jgi:flagellar protein FlgJ
VDISKINENYVNNTIKNAKTRIADDSFQNRLQSALDNNNRQELKKVCQEFEAIMLGMMYKQMKATVPKSDLIPGDIGTEMFESMLDEALIEEASRRGSFGLADILYKQLASQLETKYNVVEKGKAKVDEKK